MFLHTSCVTSKVKKGKVALHLLCKGMYVYFLGNVRFQLVFIRFQGIVWQKKKKRTTTKQMQMKKGKDEK